ncbi:MAG: hypothetical protein PWQ50_1736, partial [Methanolobus sp.]|nr:hypothetical protein [Methanolobus sp.]
MANNSFPGDLHGKSHFLAWDEEYKHVTWGGPRSISMLEGLISCSSLILDLGCGNGRFLLPLSRKYNAIGTDVSPTAVQRAREYLIKSNVEIDKRAECLASSITSI